MVKDNVIVAIDPDVDKSGVAILWVDTKKMGVGLYSLPELVFFLQEFKKENRDYIVVVEASYLSQTNWHLSWDDSQKRAAAKGRQVGRNHEIGRQIVEFCKYLEIPYQEQYPLRKCWGGKDGKITTKEIRMLTEGMGVDLPSSSLNQEERDAALLALNRSGLPLRMAQTKKQR